MSIRIPWSSTHARGLLAGVVTVGLVLLGGVLVPGPQPAEDAIRVGLVLPLTGPQAYFGRMERDAFQMALEDIDAEGGIHGRKLEFLIEDDRSRPDAGEAAAVKLIERDRVVMLGGGYGSSVTKKIAEIAQFHGVPFLINTGSADDITEQGWDCVFRLNPPASEYAASAVDFLVKAVRPATVAIIYEDTAFGQSQSRSFEAACDRAGIRCVAKESYAHADFKLWRVQQILQNVRRFRPDVIYMISYVRDADLVVTQARAMRWQPKLYLGGGGGFTMPAFQSLAAEDAEKIMTVTLWHESLPYAGAAEFAERFRKRFGQDPDYHAAEAYAAAEVIADVLRRTASFEPDDVRNALRETRLDTVFGLVEFVSAEGKTQQNRLRAYLGQWIDGRLELIWPEDVARTRYVYPIEPGR